MTRAILTDIEGTTSSLSFVHDVLFPYARERMAEFVRVNAGQPEVVRQLQAVRSELGYEANLEQVISALVEWIDADRKVTPLKALQGMIWKTGFERGDFTGHVYDDAVRCLRAWKESGIDLFVFSSGSVQAQRLLFGYSDAGDLTPLFSGFYDTGVGAKREAASYRAIAADIGLAPQDVLFLSDVAEELDAAREAGMQTVWLVRDTEPDAAARHPQAATFDAIELR
jgi:enolase-phosphatase E1